MKKKSLALLATLGLVVAQLVTTNSALAGLPRSAVSSVSMDIYGMYMSSDATCQTGLVPLIPIKSSPVTVDMTKSPILGSGLIPSTVNCVVMIMRNYVSMSYSSGSYTTTSTGGSDNVCNSGGTINVTPCGRNATRSLTWVSQIASDMNKAGLSMPTTCTSGSVTGQEIIPVYLSSYSACTGNSTFDGLIGQSNCSPNGHAPPSAANSTTAGMLMGGASAQNAYAFIFDADGIIGNSSGSCGNVNGPRFGSRGAASVSAVTSSSTTGVSPVVSAVTLSSGDAAASSTSGGATVKITGSNFSNYSVVSLGSSTCTSPTINAAGTQITCTAGSGSAGQVTVRVTNSDTGNSGTYGNGFEYRAAPTITAISPTKLASGTSIFTVTGTGFRTQTSLGAQTGSAYKVLIGTSSQTVTCSNPTITDSLGTTITCMVTHPGSTRLSQNVYVTNFPDVTNGGVSGSSVTGNTLLGFNFN